MLNKDLIKTKMRSIQEYLLEIEPILSLPKDQIVSSVEKLRTLERNFQLIVDAMLDINIHLIRELELSSPDDLKSTFIILAEGKLFHLILLRKSRRSSGLETFLCTVMKKWTENFLLTHFKKTSRILTNI